MILSVKTRERTELIDITSNINQLIQKSGTDQGLCMIYVPHTTAAVTINESADPSVKSDILMILNQIIPWEANYRHLVAIENRRLILGTWQGIFFCEFDGPRTRKVDVRIIEERFAK
jgi:thiamine phosphate synthase YjbQ (UPF0047 family)